MACILNGGELTLTGYVGDYYFDDGFTSADVVIALAQIEPDSELTVHVNSPGGIATEGASIYSLLSDRRGTTNIVVDGIAASAGSLIAMAGETVTMSAGSVMMIHDPSAFTVGTSADHLKSIEGLEALATSYARVYADKSGKSPSECREIMKSERWLTPEQAVAEGFADDTTEKKAAPVAAFDYRKFAQAPRRLVALATRKNWSMKASEPAASSASENPNGKTTMTEKNGGGDDSAELKELREKLARMEADKTDRERRDTILALPEAKGREAQATVLCDAGVTAEQAKAVLMAAPVVKEEASAPSQDEYEAGRAAGAGLNARPSSQQQPATLSANMRKLLGKETI